MKITELPLAGLLLLEPPRHGDPRGFFSETYRRDVLAEAGFDREFVQDNHSRSPARGTMRGLHFQIPPNPQDKLVRVTRGTVFDVAVDLRRGSPTYGRHAAVELSADNWRQLLVPAGFAHGFMTLSEDCEVLYKVSAYYDPSGERGLRWDDPALGIAWPLPPEAVTANERDRAWPTLEASPVHFPA
jgi:dTDP-4-dehydrorhamnose 3,5-epimerase